jgi:hypothetical protein
MTCLTLLAVAVLAVLDYPNPAVLAEAADLVKEPPACALDRRDKNSRPSICATARSSRPPRRSAPLLIRGRPPPPHVLDRRLGVSRRIRVSPGTALSVEIEMAVFRPTIQKELATGEKKTEYAAEPI